MSIAWFYVLASELVALLASAGVILDIDSSIISATVLAWGNSIGDVVANLTLALSGRPQRMQIAWSACFGTPLFSILVGLGLSIFLSAWHTYPDPFIFSVDPMITFTMAFLVLALILSLVSLPLSGMRPRTHYIILLILLYVIFIAVRLGALSDFIQL
eukprot:TRINITY_DN9927_c0_g2_i1.p1 TRINITY_DN9927_c0_g2~~TRINITY_DN9927_c0_g2_i1.p1  ORF type:complete len:158 (+),score=33.42 TRINITY_DN9927_c0_g2_i1:1-474(+)